MPPEMDHNDLSFQDDLIRPLKAFFGETSINTQVLEGKKSLEFPDDYYFPSLEILDYEKKVLKNDNEIMRDILQTRDRLKRKIVI